MVGGPIPNPKNRSTGSRMSPQFNEFAENVGQGLTGVSGFLKETFVDPTIRQGQYLASRGLEPFYNPKLESDQHSSKNPIKDPYYDYETGEKNRAQMAWDVGGTAAGFGLGRAGLALAKGATKYVQSGAAARLLEDDAARAAQAAAAKGASVVNKAKQKVAGLGLTASMLLQSAAPTAAHVGTVATETLEGAGRTLAKGADEVLDFGTRVLGKAEDAAKTVGVKAAETATTAAKHARSTAEDVFDTASKFLKPSKDVQDVQAVKPYTQKQQQQQYSSAAGKDLGPTKPIGKTPSTDASKVRPKDFDLDAPNVGMQFAQIPKVY